MPGLGIVLPQLTTLVYCVTDIFEPSSGRAAYLLCCLEFSVGFKWSVHYHVPHQNRT
jgi:hypothetical protein